MSDNHRTRFLILTLVVICSIVIAARAVTPNVAAAAAAGTTTAAAVPGAGITSGMLDFIPPNLFSEDFIASLNDYATKVSELVPPSVYEFATRWTQVITIALTPALEMIQKQIQLSKVGPTLEFWLAFAEDYTTLYPRTVLYIALGAVAALLLSVVSPVLCSSRRGSDVPQGADAETYLIDFATYKPPAHLYVTKERWAALNDFYKWAPEDLEFQFKLLDRSGLGDTTAFPDSLMSRPPKINIAAAREEAEIVMFTILDELFARNNLNPKDVDILIVNCSLFNPTPSLSAMIINRYGMRPNIMSYNLSGMGCSAGVISIALARDLMRVHKNVNVIVVSTENITQNIYLGKDKAMLISNTLFRMGGACLYLSNRRAVRHRARWQLQHVVRTHLGGDDKSYRCVFQDLDADGKLGVRLDRDLMKVAARALRSNIEEMGPKILPLTEKLRYVFRLGLYKLKKAFAGGSKEKKKKADEISSSSSNPSGDKGKVSETPTASNVLTASTPANATAAPTTSSPTGGAAEATAAARAKAKEEQKDAPPVPDFTRAVDFFCIHAGGRAVIDALEQSLSLPEKYVIPSREALRRHGNTSSASIWYELEYIEQNEAPTRGQKVWQIAFGSGFKCNSAVWKRL